VRDDPVSDLDVIGDPSIFKLIHNSEVLVRMLSTLDLNCEENTTRRNGTGNFSCLL
jgi:hypothetical protein